MTRNKPALVAVALVALVVCGGAAWYFLSGTPDRNLTVLVDGKEVDPSTLKSITGPDGKPIDLKFDLENPYKHLSQTVDEYFALQTKSERDKFLDSLIDAQGQMPKDVKVAEGGGPQMRVQTTRTEVSATQPGGKAGGHSAAGGQPKTVMIRRTDTGGGDSMPPDLRAKVAELASAMNKRRAERGLPPGPVGLMLIKKSESKTTVPPK